MKNTENLKYNKDFIQFCSKSIAKDFKDSSLTPVKNFFLMCLNKLSNKHEELLLSGITGFFYTSIWFLKYILRLKENKKKTILNSSLEEIFLFFLENYHFRYINELKYLNYMYKRASKEKKSSKCLLDNAGNFSKK